MNKAKIEGFPDQPGLIFLPLIENGRNAEPYEILQDVQLAWNIDP